MTEQVKTRRGVYLVQSKSPFRVSLLGLTFVFSSKAKMQSFLNRSPRVIDKFHKIDQELMEVGYNVNDLKIKQKALIKLYYEIMPDWVVIENE